MDPLTEEMKLVVDEFTREMRVYMSPGKKRDLVGRITTAVEEHIERLVDQRIATKDAS